VYEDVYNIVELTPGAEEFCAVLQGLGYRLAVISGGECTHPLVPLRYCLIIILLLTYLLPTYLPTYLPVGFLPIVDRVRHDLNLDYAFANTLEIKVCNCNRDCSSLYIYSTNCA
jgi:hypothetical protein